MRTLAIFGASGHGKVVADIAEQLGWDNIVFFDDAWPEVKKVGVWDVIGNSDKLITSSITNIFIAIGNGIVRNNKSDAFIQANKFLETIVHPSAIVSKYSSIGDGTIICEGAVVKAFSSIGRNNIINSNSTIGHDCIIKDGCHISLGSSIAGNVIIGDNSWIGNNASVRQNINIGSNVMIGSGSVVVKDIPSNITVVGNPAKPISDK